jgi:hypothetical protein
LGTPEVGHKGIQISSVAKTILAFEHLCAWPPFCLDALPYSKSWSFWRSTELLLLIPETQLASLFASFNYLFK